MRVLLLKPLSFRRSAGTAPFEAQQLVRLVFHFSLSFTQTRYVWPRWTIAPQNRYCRVADGQRSCVPFAQISQIYTCHFLTLTVSDAVTCSVPFLRRRSRLLSFNNAALQFSLVPCRWHALLRKLPTFCSADENSKIVHKDSSVYGRCVCVVRFHAAGLHCWVSFPFLLSSSKCITSMCL